MVLRVALHGSGVSAIIAVPSTSHCQFLACLCTFLGFPQLRNQTTPYMSQSLTLLWNATALALIALIVSHE